MDSRTIPLSSCKSEKFLEISHHPLWLPFLLGQIITHPGTSGASCILTYQNREEEWGKGFVSSP